MTTGQYSFYPLLSLQAAAVLLVMGLTIAWPGPWDVLHWSAVFIAIPAGILLLVARVQLGRSFAVTPQARELVTHGLYSRIRNPIYLFSGLLVLAFLLRLKRPYLFLAFLALIGVQTFRARQEAAVLEAKFGETYRQYRQRTWF